MEGTGFSTGQSTNFGGRQGPRRAGGEKGMESVPWPHLGGCPPGGGWICRPLSGSAACRRVHDDVVVVAFNLDPRTVVVHHLQTIGGGAHEQGQEVDVLVLRASHRARRGVRSEFRIVDDSKDGVPSSAISGKQVAASPR
ncbi:MAG: hypothetical protein CM15mP18_4470 [Methanobacteriota archaeon]|nr:MAG: hypothetical protein CM15mP18_4470 [Euryarchaeota archaeon]